MNRISELRLERLAVAPTAYSVTALARRLGVHESAVRRWESGDRVPTKRHAKALARELGVSVKELKLESEPGDDADGAR